MQMFNLAIIIEIIIIRNSPGLTRLLQASHLGMSSAKILSIDWIYK